MEEGEKKISFIGNNPFQIIILVAVIVGAFYLGSLKTKVEILERGGVGSGQKSTIPAGPNAPAAPQPPPPQSAGDVPKVTKDDHVKGDRKARIALIEYSDLECPFCKRFHPTAQQVVDEYKGKVMWVYRHFPLDQIHSKADKEAEATECAWELGGDDGFWKMTDKIFETTPSNNGLSLDDLPELAKAAGLDAAKFKECLDSGRQAARVEEQYQGGVRAGITGTPGNILLDTKSGKTRLLPGAVPFDSIKPVIDEMLKG